MEPYKDTIEKFELSLELIKQAKDAIILNTKAMEYINKKYPKLANEAFDYIDSMQGN